MTQRGTWLVAAGALLCAAGCGGNSQNSKPTTKAATPPVMWGGLPSGLIGQTGAARLLTQGTFGATLDGIQAAAGQTYADWFAAQASAPVTLQLPQVPQSTSGRLEPWWTTAVNGPDQLRQRMAFALSEILVLSGATGSLGNQVIATYEDLLAQGALGNFRDLLDAVSHSSAMGVYLSFFKNAKANAATGGHPDENYAREVMQLFTVGLVKLNQDGSVQVDSGGVGVPTYGLPEVENMARVFTGWGSQPVAGSANAWLYSQDELHPMACYPDYHDTDAKTIIGGVVIPAGGTCESDMKIALDTLFNHPNVGPFIGKQLIQRLVTSNPSPGYVSRVAGAFANDGHGTRGNLLAVAEAILTDAEARTAGTAAKLREPMLLFTNLYRAFSAADAGDSNVDDFVVELGYPTIQEAPYFSPTVFNFFRPDYQRPGPLLNAGLVAPEFQIANEYTSVVTANQLEISAFQWVDSTGKQASAYDGYQIPITPTTVLLKTAPWEPLASDAGKLVDDLGLVFMEGAMPSAMRTTIVNYLAGINGVQTVTGVDTSAPAAQIAAQRVVNAAYLVVSSPQYMIQR